MDFESLEEHRQCSIRVFVRYDETAGIECVDCDTDIYTINKEDNNG
jgi:hypothetical protein